MNLFAHIVAHLGKRINVEIKHSQSSSIQVVESLGDLRAWRKAKKKTIGFVPTMGALHNGHLELVRRAKEQCDLVVVSIFVNPFQFAPTEDFGKYPRTFERDLELLTGEQADLVFYPKESDIYPHGRDKIMAVIPPSPLNDTLEGAFRPTFFRGVATVVAKLFNLVQPDIAFFGEKDYQQLQVIKTLVRDLNIDVEIEGVATVRESDGLAMSSRNTYLTPEARKAAPALYKALESVRHLYHDGASLAGAIKQSKELLPKEDGWDLQYLKVCHAETLEELEEFAPPFVILTAAKLGEVRLIDNLSVRI